MTKRKITLMLLGLATIVFLTSGCADHKKMKQLENEIVQLNQVILQKDVKIKILTAQVKELDNTKKELKKVNRELNVLRAKSESSKK
jgi:outer membrane murein-binding lipoprotein Lpp